MVHENEIARGIEEWWLQVCRDSEVGTGDFFPELYKPQTWQESGTGLFLPPELVAIQHLTEVTLAQTLSITDPLTTAGAVAEMVLHDAYQRAITVSGMMLLIAPDTEIILNRHLGPEATRHLIHSQP